MSHLYLRVVPVRLGVFMLAITLSSLGLSGCKSDDSDGNEGAEQQSATSSESGGKKGNSGDEQTGDSQSEEVTLDTLFPSSASFLTDTSALQYLPTETHSVLLGSSPKRVNEILGLSDAARTNKDWKSSVEALTGTAVGDSLLASIGVAADQPIGMATVLAPEAMSSATVYFAGVSDEKKLSAALGHFLNETPTVSETGDAQTWTLGNYGLVIRDGHAFLVDAITRYDARGVVKSLASAEPGNGLAAALDLEAVQKQLAWGEDLVAIVNVSAMNKEEAVIEESAADYTGVSVEEAKARLAKPKGATPEDDMRRSVDRALIAADTQSRLAAEARQKVLGQIDWVIVGANYVNGELRLKGAVWPAETGEDFAFLKEMPWRDPMVRDGLNVVISASPELRATLLNAVTATAEETSFADTVGLEAETLDEMTTEEVRLTLSLSGITGLPTRLATLQMEWKDGVTPDKFKARLRDASKREQEAKIKIMDVGMGDFRVHSPDAGEMWAKTTEQGLVVTNLMAMAMPMEPEPVDADLRLTDDATFLAVLAMPLQSKMDQQMKKVFGSNRMELPPADPEDPANACSRMHIGLGAYTYKDKSARDEYCKIRKQIRELERASETARDKWLTGIQSNLGTVVLGAQPRDGGLGLFGQWQPRGASISTLTDAIMELPPVPEASADEELAALQAKADQLADKMGMKYDLDRIIAEQAGVLASPEEMENLIGIGREQGDFAGFGSGGLGFDGTGSGGGGYGVGSTGDLGGTGGGGTIDYPGRGIGGMGIKGNAKRDEKGEAKTQKPNEKTDEEANDNANEEPKEGQ